MALQTSDITADLDTFKDSNNLAVYTTNSVSYTSGNEYLLCIVGEDTTDFQAINALGTPVTTDVDWTLITGAELPYGRIGMRVYRGLATGTSSQTTEITFPVVQRNCNAGIIGISNVGNIVGVTKSTAVTTKVTSVIIPTVTPGSAAIAFFGSEAGGQWASSVGETGVLSIASDNMNIFGSYNLNEDEIMGASYTSVGDPSDYMVAIGLELQYLVANTPTITSVNGGATIGEGDLAVEIIGTNFAASGNTVIISLADDITATGALSQVITTQGASTSLEITVAVPTNHIETDPVYVFVNNGTNISAGFQTSVTPAAVTTVDTLCTLGLTSVISESTNFANGVSVELWPADVEGNKETASDVVAISSLPTDKPQYTITTTVAPSNGAGDTLHFVYLNMADGGLNAGDIKSVTGGIALVSGTYDASVAETCA